MGDQKPGNNQSQNINATSAKIEKSQVGLQGNTVIFHLHLVADSSASSSTDSNRNNVQLLMDNNTKQQWQLLVDENVAQQNVEHEKEIHEKEIQKLRKILSDQSVQHKREIRHMKKQIQLQNDLIQKLCQQQQIAKIPANESSKIKTDKWGFVEVRDGSQEFLDVLRKFKCSHNQKIISIQRVDNNRLYQKFLVEKHSVQTQLQRENLQRFPVTKELFHGTSKRAVVSICSEGFDKSYCGTSGERESIRMGEGDYFATTSNYSHIFAVPDEHETRRMILAEVVTGRYCEGYQGMKDHSRYDPGANSAVDDSNNPTMYVIFRDTQAYPKYIITYQ